MNEEYANQFAANPFFHQAFSADPRDLVIHMDDTGIHLEPFKKAARDLVQRARTIVETTNLSPHAENNFMSLMGLLARLAKIEARALLDNLSVITFLIEAAEPKNMRHAPVAVDAARFILAICAANPKYQEFLAAQMGEETRTLAAQGQKLADLGEAIAKIEAGWVVMANQKIAQIGVGGAGSVTMPVTVIEHPGHRDDSVPRELSGDASASLILQELAS
jgi:hypothetical protein